jgi:cysteine-rich repeat protein
VGALFAIASMAIVAVYPRGVRAAPVEVFILGGQSDAVGFGSMASQLPPELQAPQTDVRFWFDEGPIFALFDPSFFIDSGNAFVPLHFQSDPSRFTFGGPIDGFGSEITLGRVLADSRPVAVAIVKVAVNGASLAVDWNPATADSLYEQMMVDVAGALAALAGGGDSGHVAGFFWVQGATDAGNGAQASAYQTNLTSFIQRLRTDFAAPNMPFLLARLHVGYSLAFTGVVRTAQANVAATVARTATIDTDDLPLLADDAHLSGPAQLTLGRRFANAYLTLVPCGNGTVDPGEACDDGNAVAGDGCASGCTLEQLPVAGKELFVRDRPDDPYRRRLEVRARDASWTALGPGDPTVAGAILTVTNPGGGASGTIVLPAARWRVASPGRFTYADRRREDGPCETAFVEAGRFKVVCLGNGVPISLGPAPQGSLDVVLQLGSGGAISRYCLRFGGTIARDVPPTATTKGVFRARNAPAAAGCGAGS